MKLLRIITIGLLLMTLNSFASTPVSCSETTDLIDKMKEDKDVFSLVFKSQVYALVSTMINDAEIAQEDREQVAVSKRELVKDMYKHKMNIDSKFPEFTELNKEEKSKVMQVLTKSLGTKLKATMGCFEVGFIAEIAACGGPALTGWALTKWKWCMATVLVSDVVVSAPNAEAVGVVLEDGGFSLVVREELAFCGRLATNMNTGWVGVASCAYSATIGIVVACIGNSF
jgi:hypothetical protein